MVDGLERAAAPHLPDPPADAARGSIRTATLVPLRARLASRQVLAACGVDVERALPWVKPWFVRYQMADGGLNCDETAYPSTDECPSSMVGTVAPFEAMLLGATGRRAARVRRSRRGAS